LAEALAVVHETQGRYHEAELHRLKGEFVLRQRGAAGFNPSSTEQEAESCFRQALDLATRQRSKLLELRAAMSLSRLWHRHGKRAEARQMLAELYGWFTEGFETADLQEANALLAELS
jgi:predicted ATPase